MLCLTLPGTRRLARRRLPRDALSRGVNVEVPAQGEPVTRAHAAFKVKVWVGFLNLELEDSWTAGGGEEAQYPFRVSGSPGSVAAPLFAGLLQAAQEQFGYETGLSGNGGLGEEEADTVEDRVSAVERALGAVQKGLERLLERQSEAVARPSAAARPAGPTAGFPALPGLDNGALSEARIAGIPEAQLRALSALAENPTRMPDGRAAPAKAAVRKSGPLSQSEEEPPVGGGAGLAEEEVQKLAPVERAVVEMSAPSEAGKERGPPSAGFRGPPGPSRRTGRKLFRRCWVGRSLMIEGRGLLEVEPYAERGAGADCGVYFTLGGRGLFRPLSWTWSAPADCDDAWLAGTSITHSGTGRPSSLVVGGRGRRRLPRRGPNREAHARSLRLVAAQAAIRFRELVVARGRVFAGTGRAASSLRAAHQAGDARAAERSNIGPALGQCCYEPCERAGVFRGSPPQAGRRWWAPAWWRKCSPGPFREGRERWRQGRTQGPKRRQERAGGEMKDVAPAACLPEAPWSGWLGGAESFRCRGAWSL